MSLDGLLPAHKAVAAIPEEQRQIVQEAFEWLLRHHVLAQWADSDIDRLLPVYTPVEELMFEFFGIDMKQFYDERQQVYDELVRTARKTEGSDHA